VEPQQLLEIPSPEKQWSLAKLSEAKQWSKWVTRYQERLQRENGEPI
jgi:hypothetical protein